MTAWRLVFAVDEAVHGLPVPQITFRAELVFAPQITFDPHTTLVPQITLVPQTTLVPQITLLSHTTFEPFTIRTALAVGPSLDRE